MDKILDILAAYPTWVKFLVVILSAVILLLLISFRESPNPAQSSQQEHELPLSVEIEGPATAPLGKTTYYTVLVKNAVRGIWSIGGIQNEPVVVQPLGPSHQIYVEPTDATRVGNSFTIVFVAYDTQGRSAIAKKRFLVVSN
jgi:hypothetical protein